MVEKMTNLEQSGSELYSLIEKALLDQDFLKNIGVGKRVMETALIENQWKIICYEIENDKNIKCKDILEASLSTLSSLSELPEEGLLQYIFKYTNMVLFPDLEEKQIKVRDQKYCKARLIFSEILDQVMKLKDNRGELDPRAELHFLSSEEIVNCPTRGEYENLKAYFAENYMDNFLRIGAEITPFNTKGHIAGVHYVSMHVGRQLKKVGAPIDLACISGAAIAHDIGKFGCKTAEHSRIPYLHYYYTDEFLSRLKTPHISHIASNHSTWDLEIENLSVESLILIYADFRTKSSRDENGIEIVNFYSLEDAFNVILSKLDNVDDAKKARYIRVYKKLHDFEKYMKASGVSVKLNNSKEKKVNWKDPSLLTNREAVDRLKYLAIRHNIEVMNRVNGEITFGNLLEHARSEKDWKNIRAYLNAIGEYYTYMTAKQKDVTVQFLTEVLYHREGDIRRQVAILIGNIISTYDEKYRKELPEGVEVKTIRRTAMDLWVKHLNNILYPDLKTTEEQKRWMGYTLKITLEAMLKNPKNDNNEAYIAKFKKLMLNKDLDETSIFIMLDTALEIPAEFNTDKDNLTIVNFAIKNIYTDNIEVKVSCYRVLKLILEHMDVEILPKATKARLQKISKIRELEDGMPVSVVFLQYRIRKALGIITEAGLKKYKEIYDKESQSVAIFRENLKVATPWVIKAVNIKLLLREMREGDRTEVFYLAMHFSNLLKISERVTVRHLAGEGLLEVFKLLTFNQRNEIVVELTKGLEIGDYQFSKYIPQYLGPLALDLQPAELDEFLNELKTHLNGGNKRVVPVILDTLGEVLRRYSSYEDVDVKKEDYLNRKQRIIGMLLKGMSNYAGEINKEAFMVIGQHVFGSEFLTIEEKFDIFKRMHKKMLTLITSENEDELTFFTNAAALNHIYRFIAEYEYLHKELKIEAIKKAAFFPGTFDPFSLSHKGIAIAIRDLGYEVYMAIDEFSWSKKTQPRAIRKRIINMSIADEKDIYVFPDEEPINIANHNDIEKLKTIAGDKELYIVVGSDVVANASSYKVESSEHSIHSLNHLIFKRESNEEVEVLDSGYEEACHLIKGKIEELSLPTHLEDISSTRIRDNIDSNRDISSLIDPVTQRYIYDYSLYMREPQYKHLVTSKGFFFMHLSEKNEQGERGTAIGDLETGKILARARVRETHTGYLYEEFKSEELAAYVRKNALGKIIVIQDLIIDKKMPDLDLYQLILTETLADALNEDMAYAVYKLKDENETNKSLIGTLERQGFKEIIINNRGTGTYAVDMRKPVVLIQNMDTMLKNPFDTNKRVLKAMDRAHKRMQLALTKMYKGSLVMSINSSVLNQKLIEKITSENGVPSTQGKERKLGPYMCVPYGNILRGMVVPNTVTKTLHTEKYFDPEMKGSEIEEYQYYATIENQIEMLKSFDRKLILVDDILHKGYRVKRINAKIKEANMQVKKIIVGLLSGRGKDLMTVQGRSVDSVYFIPNLEAWFVESAQYPFIGGDAIKREKDKALDSVRSINLILPYVMPRFLDEFNKDVIYMFSKVCLENALEIFEVLEAEYQEEFQRKLTLQRLSEAVSSPKLPDVGECLEYDKNLSPSSYIRSDIEKLVRLKGLIG